MAFSSPAGIIYQALIQSNCHAFVGGDVDVVSQLDAAGTRWQAHALRTDDGGRRAAVLSGAGPTLYEAFEELHRKSAQAVDRYVAANGFDAVPRRAPARQRRTGKRGPVRGSSTEGSDSERSLISSSTLTVSSASGSESDTASSGGDEDGVVDVYKRWLGRKQAMDKARAKKMPGFDSNKCRESANHGAVERPWDTSLPPRPVRANKTGPQPPLGHMGVITPPPGWPTARLPSMGKTVGVGERGRGNSKAKTPGPLPPPPMFKVPGLRPAVHHASTPTPTPMPTPRVAPVKMSIILTVDWAGHGQATFADECELSAAAVRNKTRTLLALRLGDFSNVSPHHFSAGRRFRGYEVEVRRVRVDGHVFVVTGGDDDCLAMVVASIGPAPRVVHVFVHVAADHDDG